MKAMEANMKIVEQYRQYAADCKSMARKAADSDRHALLQIAEAWDALAAQREEQVRATSDE
jgi:hypothetical protein